MRGWLGLGIVGALSLAGVPATHAGPGVGVGEVRTELTRFAVFAAIYEPVKGLREDVVVTFSAGGTVVRFDAVVGKVRTSDPRCTSGASSVTCYEPSGFVTTQVDTGLGNDRIEIRGLPKEVAAGIPGHAFLYGGEGDDVLLGGEVGDSISGGGGNDVLVGGGGEDVLNGGLGTDDISGGAGRDHVTYDEHLTPVTVTLDGIANDGSLLERDWLHADIEDVLGSSAPGDRITGDDGSNVLELFSGQPGELRGLGGGDVLIGGGMLDGGDGPDDLLAYHASADRLFGGGGDDHIIANPYFVNDPDAVIDCGAGFDSADVDVEDPPSTSCEDITVTSG